MADNACRCGYARTNGVCPHCDTVPHCTTSSHIKCAACDAYDHYCPMCDKWYEAITQANACHTNDRELEARRERAQS